METVCEPSMLNLESSKGHDNDDDVTDMIHTAKPNFFSMGTAYEIVNIYVRLPCIICMSFAVCAFIQTMLSRKEFSIFGLASVFVKCIKSIGWSLMIRVESRLCIILEAKYQGSTGHLDIRQVFCLFTTR